MAGPLLIPFLLWGTAGAAIGGTFFGAKSSVEKSTNALMWGGAAIGALLIYSKVKK